MPPSPPESAGSAPGPTPAASATYRPHLDGLRCLAVYLVVAFHAGMRTAEGGFIGVDVFFVLSGYLVTTVLLRDLAGGGRIRFGRFYARRVRRLLPAAFLALVGTAVVYTAVASTIETDRAASAVRAAFLYWANWHFIAEASDYFGDVDRNPVLHVWSLAVEEQFYLVWPLLLAGLVAVASKVGRHRDLVLRLAVGAGIAASVTAALVLRHDQPNRAYFGTDTRAYQLLAGALLALTAGVMRRVARLGAWAEVGASASVLALLVLASRLVDLDPIERGIATTLVTLGLLVGLEARNRGWLHRVLSLSPVVYLGQISYGTYLWHWPVVVLGERFLAVRPGFFGVIVAGVASGLAALSAALVERPVRASAFLDRVRWPVVAVGLSVSVLAGLVLVPAVMRPGFARAVSSSPTGGAAAPAADLARALTPVPSWFDERQVHEERFTDPSVLCPPSTVHLWCTVRRGSGAHVLLVGDSTGVMMAGPVRRAADQADLTLTLAVDYGCPWQLGVDAANAPVESRADCRRRRARLYEDLDTIAPDVVVVMNAYTVQDLDVARDTETERRHELDRTAESARALTATGASLLIIEPLPRGVGPAPLECLGSARYVESCRFRAREVPSTIERLERRLAEQLPRVDTLDLDRAACPLLPVCDPIVGHTVVWWDGVHLTRRYAASLDDEVLAGLRRTGRVPPAPR